MSTIRSGIQEKIKEAMRSKDSIALLVFRNLISDFKKWEVDNIKTLTDEIALKIIQSNIKQRDQSIESYKTAGREDLAEKEITERKLLEGFLPTQMPEEEARAIVNKIISGLDPSQKQMGAVMKAVMTELQGKIDSKIISNLVRECLKI